MAFPHVSFGQFFDDEFVSFGIIHYLFFGGDHSGGDWSLEGFGIVPAMQTRTVEMGEFLFEGEHGFEGREDLHFGVLHRVKFIMIALRKTICKTQTNSGK